MFKKIILGLIVLLALLFGAKKYIWQQKLIIGEMAPDFEAELVNGEQLSMSDLKGNFVLVSFWGSWCAPCIREAPKLVDLYETYHQPGMPDNSNLVIVSIALEKNDANWERAADRLGFTWKNQIVEVSRYVLLSPLAQKFGVSEVPTKYLINPDGRIIGSDLTLAEIENVLKENLNSF